jgi:4-aminobutyrate aminotransferase-like enzyme
MTRMAGAGSAVAGEEPIRDRRRRLLGPTYSLFYDEPVHPVRGEGVWLHAADGTRYLDCYNNVVSVGHCHPHVVAALSRQAARLNTHTRYLDDTVLDLAERLIATAPSHLGHALFTCTGSEANDLALRIAEHATGGSGAIVTAFAYHGNTRATAALSPAAGGLAALGESNVAIPAPDTFRDGGAAAVRFLDNLETAIERLRERGRRPAALILDASFSSDGIFVPAPELLSEAAAIIRSAGGLMIADEVQAGFGRLGRSMWGFEHYGYAPDIVTMGKPMGDGHPVAGLMVRPDLVKGFGAKEGYFNTFGGNPVTAAVGLAVLEVIDGEGLIANAGQVGAYLRQRLDGLRGRHAAIADVRGMGLYCGVEIAGTADEARRRAAAIVNGLRRRRVLIGACGPDGNVLKIRPPLPFAAEHADRLVEALDAVLSQPDGNEAAPC